MALTRPIAGFKFQVSCPKLTGVCGFSTISGLESETEVVEYREGCDVLTMRKFRGLVSFPLVVCSKGVTSAGSELINWYNEVADMRNGGEGQVYPKFRCDVEIKLDDREGRTARRFNLRHAWPSRLAFDDLDASSSDILIHRLELAHEGIVFI